MLARFLILLVLKGSQSVNDLIDCLHKLFCPTLIVFSEPKVPKIPSMKRMRINFKNHCAFWIVLCIFAN